MDNPLHEYLKGRRPQGFKPVPRYSSSGDVLEAYWEDAPAYADQITPYLIVMRAFGDKRAVGVKVFGVRGMVELAGRAGSATVNDL